MSDAEAYKLTCRMGPTALKIKFAIRCCYEAWILCCCCLTVADIIGDVPALYQDFLKLCRFTPDSALPKIF